MPERKRGGATNVRVTLIEAKPGEAVPEIAVRIIDAAGAVLCTERVAGGQVSLPTDILSRAARVQVGPADVDPDEAEEAAGVTFRAAAFRAMIEKGSLVIGPARWKPWLYFTVCVSGNVRRCFPKPWVLEALASKVSAVSETANFFSGKLLQEADFRPSFHGLFPRCTPVCVGVVDVYTRRCCCQPLVVFDPRLREILVDLEEVVAGPFPRDPQPGPDPAPFLTRSLDPQPVPWAQLDAVTTGWATDVRKLNAKADLEALRKLTPADQIAYLHPRHYLWCKCSAPKKVASGTLADDGSFDVCWKAPLQILPRNCHIEVAYKVRQPRNGGFITIYDGVAAGQWFDLDDKPTLTSYSPFAVGCDESPVPGNGPFVVLESIGDADSHRLATPDQDGVFSVENPVYNSGLLDPVDDPADALGVNKNCNFGGTVRLRYRFTDGMKAQGAVFYRVQVAPANASGNPSGSWAPLSVPSWRFWNITTGDEAGTPLGPHAPGGETGLYRIPFDGIAPIGPLDEWLDGQYHAEIDTSALPNARYLIAIEVFDAGGNRIRPTGSSGAGIEKAFTFRRWVEPGNTDPVPYAALTHMFWWDNRKAVATIVDIRKNGVPSSAQCQFLEGGPAETVSIGYRAYHPKSDVIPPGFVLNHGLYLQRGLGGPGWSIQDDDGTNAGFQPPVGSAPHESQTLTFAELLKAPPVGLRKCAFSVSLYVTTKTTNGEGHSSTFDDSDHASFAAEVIS